MTESNPYEAAVPATEERKGPRVPGAAILMIVIAALVCALGIGYAYTRKLNTRLQVEQARAASANARARYLEAERLREARDAATEEK